MASAPSPTSRIKSEDSSGDGVAGAQENHGGAETAASTSEATTWGESASRVNLTPDDLNALSGDKLKEVWAEQERYLDQVEAKCREAEAALAESQQQQQKRQDVSRREHLLVMRLSTKEQEVQEMSAQIQELKAAQVPSAAQLRSTLVDPAVNVIIQKLKVQIIVKKP